MSWVRWRREEEEQLGALKEGNRGGKSVTAYLVGEERRKVWNN